MSGDIDLANFEWRNFGLVVIDESHNFRNMEGNRYQRLLNEIIRQGAPTRVLMLSATPVNTSLTDLRNQIYLITEGREDDFRDSLGVGNMGNMLATAQKEFKHWESGGSASGPRNKTALLDKLGAEFFRLLGGITISRSRRQIKQFYAPEMERIGKFPTHATPVNRHPPTDRLGSLSYQELADQIDEFALSIYRPTDYLIDETRRRELVAERKARNFNQQDRERFLIGMIRTNFLKRLESSAHSLRLTLERTLGKIDAMLERIDRYERDRFIEDYQAGDLPDDDEDDEDFIVNRGHNPYRLRELDLSRWRADMVRDKATLAKVLSKVQNITPERDGKLHAIKQAIRNKVENPTTDQDGKRNRKLLVFTTFKDTAEYLYENLSGLVAELELNTAMVSGEGTTTNFGENNFNAILTNFAPVARKRGSDDEGGEIDLLIATDCISEGQNLQDCDTVLNYDIHWNPVRLIQRFGRIDRIGSRSSVVHMVNYWPTADMDAYLRLKNRVQARMALADVAASGDEDPFHRGVGATGTEIPRRAVGKVAAGNSGLGRTLRRGSDERLHPRPFPDPAPTVLGKESGGIGSYAGRCLRNHGRRRQPYGQGPARSDCRLASTQRDSGPTPTAGQPSSSLLHGLHSARWHDPLRLRQRQAGAGRFRGGNGRQIRSVNAFVR